MNNEEISQRTIRDLITGRLDEAATDRLDELSIIDAAFADRIAAERYELVDDWIAGRLDKNDKAAFESVLARSPALRESVEISRTLAAAAPKAVVVERSQEPSFLARLFGGMPRLAYGFAGLLVLLVGVGIAALLLSREGGTEVVKVSPTPTASPAPSAAASSTDSPSAPPAVEEPAANDLPVNRVDRAEPPVNRDVKPPRRPTVIATLILSPPTRGAGGVRSVTVGDDVEFLNLTVQTEAPADRAYVIDLGDPSSGSSDWRSAAVRGKSANGRTVISVKIPAAKLRPGVRAVRVTESGSASDVIDEHLIRIQR